MLTPGLLFTDRLTFLEPVRASNGAGGWVDSWATAGSCNGAVSLDSGVGGRDEGSAGDQPLAPATVELTFQTSLQVQPEWRVQSPDGTVYELLRLSNVGPVFTGIGRKV